MPPSIRWPHAPEHRLGSSGTYFVTAATYGKAHHFRSAERLAVLHRGLLQLAAEFGWTLEAWAVFSNHYHFVGRPAADSSASAKGAHGLPSLLGQLHERTAKWVNRLDSTPARSVWFNYWDTQLSHQRCYLARLNYVHQNAVRHGLVTDSTDYPWCSAGWFQREATAAQIKTLAAFEQRRVVIEDESSPDSDW